MANLWTFSSLLLTFFNIIFKFIYTYMYVYIIHNYFYFYDVYIQFVSYSSVFYHSFTYHIYYILIRDKIIDKVHIEMEKERFDFHLNKLVCIIRMFLKKNMNKTAKKSYLNKIKLIVTIFLSYKFLLDISKLCKYRPS